MTIAWLAHHPRWGTIGLPLRALLYVRQKDVGRLTTLYGIGFRTKQAVNPLDRGHIAFRTDDIAAFKKRLDEKGIPYSDYGTWAMNGWHQIFFYDPEGNVIEVHQVAE